MADKETPKKGSLKKKEKKKGKSKESKSRKSAMKTSQLQESEPKKKEKKEKKKKKSKRRKHAREAAEVPEPPQFPPELAAVLQQGPAPGGVVGAPWGTGEVPPAPGTILQPVAPVPPGAWLPPPPYAAPQAPVAPVPVPPWVPQAAPAAVPLPPEATEASAPPIPGPRPLAPWSVPPWAPQAAPAAAALLPEAAQSSAPPGPRPVTPLPVPPWALQAAPPAAPLPPEATQATAPIPEPRPVAQAPFNEQRPVPNPETPYGGPHMLPPARSATELPAFSQPPLAPPAGAAPGTACVRAAPGIQPGLYHPHAVLQPPVTSPSAAWTEDMNFARGPAETQQDLTSAQTGMQQLGDLQTTSSAITTAAGPGMGLRDGVDPQKVPQQPQLSVSQADTMRGAPERPSTLPEGGAPWVHQGLPSTSRAPPPPLHAETKEQPTQGVPPYLSVSAAARGPESISGPEHAQQRLSFGAQGAQQQGLPYAPLQPQVTISVQPYCLQPTSTGSGKVSEPLQHKGTVTPPSQLALAPLLQLPPQPPSPQVSLLEELHLAPTSPPPPTPQSPLLSPPLSQQATKYKEKALAQEHKGGPFPGIGDENYAAAREWASLDSTTSPVEEKEPATSPRKSIEIPIYQKGIGAGVSRPVVHVPAEEALPATRDSWTQRGSIGSRTSLTSVDSSTKSAGMTGKSADDWERERHRPSLASKASQQKPDHPITSKGESTLGTADGLDRYGRSSLSTDSRVSAAVRRLRFAATLADNLRSASHAVRQLEYPTEEEQLKRDRVAADLLRRAALASQEAHAASIALVEAKTALDRAKEEGSSEYSSAVESLTPPRPSETFSVERAEMSSTAPRATSAAGISKHRRSQWEKASDASATQRPQSFEGLFAHQRDVRRGMSTFSFDTSVTARCTRWSSTSSAPDGVVREAMKVVSHKRPSVSQEMKGTTGSRSTSIPHPSNGTDAPLTLDQPAGIRDSLQGQGEEADETQYFTAEEVIKRSATATPGGDVTPPIVRDGVPTVLTPVRELQDVGLHMEQQFLNVAGAGKEEAIECKKESLISPTHPSPIRSGTDFMSGPGVTLLELLAAEGANEELLTAAHPTLRQEPGAMRGDEGQGDIPQVMDYGEDEGKKAEEALMADLDTTAALYPESGIVLLLGVFCLIWIAFLMITSSVRHHSDTKSDVPNANTSKPSKPLGLTTATSSDDYHPYYTVPRPIPPFTFPLPTISPRPLAATYVCDTSFCLRESDNLNAVLGIDPCRNFYDYVCLKVDESRQPRQGVSISTDTLLVQELEDQILNYIRSHNVRDMRLTRDLLSQCEASQPFERIKEVAGIIDTYVPSGVWPVTQDVPASASWKMAARILKDLGIDSLVKAALDPSPENPGAKIITIATPQLLVVEGDGDDNVNRIKQATESFLRRIHHSTDTWRVAESAGDFARLLAKAWPPNRRPRPEAVSLSALLPEIKTLLQIFYTGSLPPTILLKTPDSVISVTKIVEQHPVSTVNYLVFRILLYFAPYLGIPLLSELFPLTFGAFPADPKKHCSRVVERILPVAYMRALSAVLGPMTLAHLWASQVQSKFLRALPRLQWFYKRSGKASSNDAQLAKYKLRRTRVGYLFPYRATHDRSWTTYEKYMDAEVAKASGILGRVKAAAQARDQDNYTVSAFMVHAPYLPARRLLYIPVGLFNTSVPRNSSIFVFHIARFGVRIYRSLMKVLRPGDETPGGLAFSDVYEQRMNGLYKCLEEDFQLMPGSLMTGFTDQPQGSILLEESVSVILAHYAFQQLLNTKRIWGTDFRLKGLKGMSSDQLFFIYFALDNCERGDEASARRQKLLPAQERVNAALRQSTAFAAAFHCNVGDAMTARRLCPLVYT